MIWLYIFSYFLGAVITGFLFYISLIKKYKKEKSALKFSMWVEAYSCLIFICALIWFIVLPIGIIVYLINKITERINKYYNIEL